MAKAKRIKLPPLEECIAYKYIDPDSDRAWNRLIRSKYGKNLRDHGFPKDKNGFRFPMGGLYHELWCVAWEHAWRIGYARSNETIIGLYEEINRLKNDRTKKGKKVRRVQKAVRKP